MLALGVDEYLRDFRGGGVGMCSGRTGEIAQSIESGMEQVRALLLALLQRLR